MSPDGTIHQEYETLVNPDRDLGPARIHRITAREIMHAPKFTDIAGDVAELLSRAKILAGHNVSFDRNFLIKEFERVGITMPDIPILCTCQLLGRNNLLACCQELDVVFKGEPITRNVAEMLAEQAGLIVANGVTKKLDLLVVADPNTQSGKAKKARQYGTRILADSVFWRMIGVSVE
jgi:NAD-dependent DNA ligase